MKRNYVIGMAAFGIALILSGCAGKKVEQVAEAPKELSPDDFFALAYKESRKRGYIPYSSILDGDYQSEYEPKREMASEKVELFEKTGIPSIDDSENYLAYLGLLDSSGKHIEFEKRLKAFLFQKPKDKKAQFLFAVHALRKKKTDLAVYYLRQLEKEEKFEWRSLVLNNLAMVALQDGNRPLAISYLEKAISANPPASAPHANLGALYLQTRSYAQAEKMFRRACEVDPRFEDAVLGLGVALQGQGKFEAAHGIYEAFLKMTPDALSVVYNDAIILGNKLEQREEAAQLMLRYIQRGGKETAKAHEIIKTWR